ncbi:MAG TPA: hypothetical protein VMF06_10145 [Candidatus Limnocylindria bacterium]|nr:hypothetical protein [Candidatus Limnocylindria bacterium]
MLSQFSLRRVLRFTLMYCTCTLFATIAWCTCVTGHLYLCTESTGFDYFHPGDWVHHPISAPLKAFSDSMSEPDVILEDWTLRGLWMIWCSMFLGSLVISILFALKPGISWIIPRPHASSAGLSLQEAEQGPDHLDIHP